MDEQQYQTALKQIRSPHTRPEKYRGVGANRTNFLSVSGCSESWTSGTIVTSLTNCQLLLAGMSDWFVRQHLGRTQLNKRI